MGVQYITVKEAATILDLEVSRVRQLAIKEVIKGVKRPDNEYRGIWFLEVQSVYQYGTARRKKEDRRGMNSSNKARGKK